LAALTAQQIEMDIGDRVQAVYTFGMPRPGDATLATAYNQRPGQRTYRLAYGEDLVPTVPQSTLGFQHLGRYLHCDRGAKFDGNNLASGARSDEPQFVHGISNELTSLIHGPLSNFSSPFERLKLAAWMAIGKGPAGLRTDPAES
jgi:triacylglycerol lipase